MTDPESEGSVLETSGPPSRPYFSPVVTIACAIVMAIYVGAPVGPLISRSSSPLDQLERPERSLDRLVTRELDLRAAMRKGVGWEWRLYQVLSGFEDPARQAGVWYAEIIHSGDSARAELHRAILLAETGDLEGARNVTERWKPQNEPDERMTRWMSAAYLEPAPEVDAGRALIAQIHDRLEPDWFADTLTARIAARIGDTAARSEAEAAILARGRALQIRLRILMAVVIGLLLAGIVACVRLSRGRARVADAPLPAAWSFRDGFALFVRGLGAPQVIILVAFSLIPRQGALATPLAMAADLPVFWWVARYLRAHGARPGATFGLGPRARAGGRLVAAALALIAIALVGDASIDAIGDLVGLPSHWADGFAEDILWDSRGAFVADALNVTVWAPIVEELIFRGLLYGTLRTRIGVWPAAFASATLFALPHGYAMAGSISVFMSGVLWALAYERTRSLVPGVLAHSVNNIMSTLWVAVLLR